MKRFLLSATFRIIRALLYGALGAFLVLIFLFVWDLEKRPDLKVWHKVELDAEFTTESKVKNFQEYLDLEEKLFAQLDEQVYDRIQPEDRSIINRYNKGSMADPDRSPPNWNRTFELTTDCHPGPGCCYCTACPTLLTVCAVLDYVCIRQAPGWSACECLVMVRHPRVLQM